MTFPPVIPSRAPFDVVLDANCLIDVLDHASHEAALSAWLHRSPAARIFLPLSAILEALDSRQIAARLAVLRRMCQHPRIAVAAELQHAIELEAANWQPAMIAEPDLDFRERIPADAAEVPDVLSALRELAKSHGRLKDNAFNLDGALPAWLEEDHGFQLEPAHAAHLIEHHLRLEPKDLALVEAVKVAAVPVAPERLIAAPWRYPVANLWAHFVFRHTHANAVARRARGKPVGNQSVALWRTRLREGDGGRGTWHDNMIAATAALADVLVTRDENLRDKCNFLRARGLLRFSTVTLGGLFSSRPYSDVPTAKRWTRTPQGRQR